MKIVEHVTGLFKRGDYVMPEGNYNITRSATTYSVNSTIAVMIPKHFLELTTELQEFYNFMDSREYFVEKLPCRKERGILITLGYFEATLKDYFKEKADLIKLVRSLTTPYYCVSIRFEHDIENPEATSIEYIKNIRGREGFKKLKKIYFSVIKEFYNYITILRAPYINLTDINHLYIHGIYVYYCGDKNQLIPYVVPLLFDYYLPSWPELSVKLKEFFDKKESISIEELFMAKAKVYERLNSKSLAIIHAVIALEAVVPKFINEYLKTQGVDSDSVQDFNNKFGLSVRVKALLKIILPKEMHDVITKVGATIKYRNKIMHEGKTDEFFENIDVADLVSACNELMVSLKVDVVKVGK